MQVSYTQFSYKAALFKNITIRNTVTYLPQVNI